MKTLVIDIETIGENFDELDEVSQHMLTRWVERSATSDESREVQLKDIKEGLGFSPLTGQIVAIGMVDGETGKGGVYFQAPGASQADFEEEGIVYRVMTEEQMLAGFWEKVKGYQEVVTFNGYGFDVPYLNIRSAVHGIRPTANLMVNRYLSSQKYASIVHVDLQDQLSYYGATRRKGSLHMYCRAFGIKSPKAGGVAGDDVKPLFDSGKFVDIARYNGQDITCTLQLYKKWDKYLRF